MRSFSSLRLLPLMLLLACSPKFDWRDVQGAQAPFTVLMPSKPTQISRDIQLGQRQVTMQMIVSQIDGVTFAVGSFSVSDPTQAQAALPLMKQALLTNLSGKIVSEKNFVVPKDGRFTDHLNFEAIGDAGNPNKPKTTMIGNLVARDTWVCQLLVVGSDINQDSAETFLSSFHLK